MRIPILRNIEAFIIGIKNLPKVYRQNQILLSKVDILDNQINTILYNLLAPKYIITLNSKYTKSHLIQFYVPNFIQDFIQGYIVKTGKFFEQQDLETLNKYLSSNSVILDIGANIGNHSVYWSKITEVKKIYAFEPIKQTFNTLSKNIEINNLQEKVIIYNFGIGSKKTQAYIQQYNPKNIGSTSLQEIQDSTENIAIKDLDSLDIKEKIDFVKIDIEGMELQALQGGKKFFEKHKPIIFIEIFPKNYKEVNNLLLKYGYKLEKKFPNDNFLYIAK